MLILQLLIFVFVFSSEIVFTGKMDVELLQQLITIYFFAEVALFNLQQLAITYYTNSCRLILIFVIVYILLRSPLAMRQYQWTN